MKCDVCKTNEAVVYVRKIAGKEETVIHLCEVCAVNEGFMGDDSAFLTSEMTLSQLFSGLLNIASNYGNKEEIKCPKCGVTIEDLKKYKKLGCADCYDYFAEDIIKILEKNYRSLKHIGKLPAKVEVLNKLTVVTTKLKKRLQIAVENEEYEVAAILRDQLKNIVK